MNIKNVICLENNELFFKEAICFLFIHLAIFVDARARVCAK